jgi:hypothetical protein
VPSTINNSESIYESSPVPGTGLTYTYRSDGSGDSSNNTGFFFLFKQGTMQQIDFTVDTAITNYVKSLNISNINDSDVWLYRVGPVWPAVRTVDQGTITVRKQCNLQFAVQKQNGTHTMS